VFGELIPEIQPFARALVDAAGAAGLQPRVTSTVRTYAQQKRLYSRYVAGLSPYPAAPPGQSAHEYGWAFDMVSTDNGACGDFWQQLGGVWGATRDPVHFEFPGFKAALGPQIRTAQVLDDTSNNAVTRAMKALHDLPWYIALLVPEQLLQVEQNTDMDVWAASVFEWIRQHTP